MKKMISRQMEKRQIELEYISMKDNAIMASLLIVIFVLLMICKTSELDLCTPEWWKFNVISAIACVMFYLFFDWMHSFILETVFMQREEMELELEKLNTDKPIKVIPKTVDPFDFEINKSKGTYLARFKNLKKEEIIITFKGQGCDKEILYQTIPKGKLRNFYKFVDEN